MMGRLIAARSQPSPSVSVCVPARDHGRFIEEALHSVLEQPFRNLEVIVVDDASSDDTEERVRGTGDGRVRYVRTEEPVGVAATRNIALRLARGELVAWLDADDAYEFDAVGRLVAAFERSDEVVLAHGAFRVVDEQGGDLPPWPQLFPSDTVERGGDAFAELSLENWITTSTTMARAQTCREVGGFDPAIGPSSTDWHLWLRLALRGDLAYVATPLARYRQHEATISDRTRADGTRVRCDVRAVRAVLRTERPRIERFARCERRARVAQAIKAIRFGGEMVTRGERSAAVGAMLWALRLFPPLSRSRAALAMIWAAIRGLDYEQYRLGKRVLADLCLEVDGSRFAERLAPVVREDPDWEARLREVAAIVDRAIPPRARIAVIDKWDPTILHFARRHGWHFPDRRLMPGGYPPDDAAAIKHLAELKQLGAEYLVVPSGAYWWLEFYREFRAHLKLDCRLTWASDECEVYFLSTPASRSM